MRALFRHSLSNSRRLHIVTTATHCNTLQHTATHCNTLQYTAPYTARSVAKESYKEEGSLSTQSEQFRATTHCCYCSTVQHTATRCNTLQHAAPSIARSVAKEAYSFSKQSEQFKKTTHCCYGVATVSRIDKITGLFCRI